MVYSSFHNITPFMIVSFLSAYSVKERIKDIGRKIIKISERFLTEKLSIEI